MNQITHNCKAEMFIPSKENWKKITSEIVSLENAAFPHNSYSEGELEKDFTNPENSIVLLRDLTTQKIVGYMYAVSIDKWEPERFAERADGMQIDNVVIDTAYRGHRLVGTMASLLEHILRERHYTYFEIKANIPNGYADSIAKVYKDRIMGTPHRTEVKYDSLYGARMHYKIRL